MTNFDVFAANKLHDGYVFYSPSGRRLFNFRDVIDAWVLYRVLCYRRKHSNKLWEVTAEGVRELV